MPAPDKTKEGKISIHNLNKQQQTTPFKNKTKYFQFILTYKTYTQTNICEEN